MGEQDGGLYRPNDLDLTWGFDLHPFFRGRSQEEPAAGDAGNGTAETMDLSQGGAVDASSVPTGWAETVETVGSSQGGAVDVDASFVPARRAETIETVDSSQGGRGVRLLGPARESRKRLRRISSLRRRSSERRRPPRGPVGERRTRAQLLGTASPDSKGPDPGLEPTPGGWICSNPA